MNRFVIRGGHVISLDPDIGILAAGDVLVADGRIEAVGSRLDIPLMLRLSTPPTAS